MRLLSCIPSALTCGCCLTFLLVGCGPAPLPTHPVSGIVTKGGQPVAGAAVTFLPETADGRSAVGITDESGKYQLTTLNKDDGALEGNYQITIAKYEGGDTEVASQPAEAADPYDITDEYPSDYDESKANAGNPKASKNSLPAKYANASQSGLTATVVAGENTFDFSID